MLDARPRSKSVDSFRYTPFIASHNNRSHTSYQCCLALVRGSACVVAVTHAEWRAQWIEPLALWTTEIKFVHRATHWFRSVLSAQRRTMRLCLVSTHPRASYRIKRTSQRPRDSALPQPLCMLVERRQDLWRRQGAATLSCLTRRCPPWVQWTHVGPVR